MSDNTTIEWTDHTFNPWWGCSRVSPGCRFCYADRDATRYGHSLWRRHGERRMLSDANWAKPIKWNREAEKAGIPAKVFCASMADVFEDHPQVVEPRKRLWDVIDSTPWLIWQLLTKRPENVADMAPWGESWPTNVWLGTSVEDQTRADQRIPILRALPAWVKFLSCEPLLGPVYLGRAGAMELYRPGYATDEAVDLVADPDFPQLRTRSFIDWVIVGGESGPKARPMHPDWARSLRDQCQAAGVPFLFKQWGEWAPTAVATPTDKTPIVLADGWGDISPARTIGTEETYLWRVGKKTAGRELDGRTWDEYPQAAIQ